MCIEWRSALTHRPQPSEILLHNADRHIGGSEGAPLNHRALLHPAVFFGSDPIAQPALDATPEILRAAFQLLRIALAASFASPVAV